MRVVTRGGCQGIWVRRVERVARAARAAATADDREAQRLSGKAWRWERSVRQSSGVPPLTEIKESLHEVQG
jgi:hypothetical protein